MRLTTSCFLNDGIFQNQIDARYITNILVIVQDESINNDNLETSDATTYGTVDTNAKADEDINADATSSGAALFYAQRLPNCSTQELFH